jgi:Flp pilus assembly protein TadD
VAKRHRTLAFCAIWFLSNLAIEALAASIELIFEHRVYLPSMLFFLPFVWLLLQWLKPKAAFSILGGLIILLSFWTYHRNAIWNDPVGFWEDAVRKSPNHYRGYANLGISYLHAKSYDHAVASLKESLTLNPPYPTEIYTNLGVVHLETGQHDLAEQDLRHAVLLDPSNYFALNHLGTLSRYRKNYRKALEHHQMAIMINPNFAPSHYNMGKLYMEMGKLTDAERAFRRAADLRPMWSQAYSGLGLALAKQGRYDLAVRAMHKATTMDAKNQEALFNLAIAYQATGRYEKAVQTYKVLLEINPKDVEAMHNLGTIYLESLNDIKRATFYFKQALAAGPGYDQAAVVKNTLSQLGVKLPAYKKGVMPSSTASQAPSRPTKP